MIGAKPEWRHKELVLPIGEGQYRFRTLSLYDVWCLWPTFASAHESILAHHPIQYSQSFLEALEHLCPGLTKSKDFLQLKSAHIDALAEFFVAQDWKRIKVMGDSVGDNSKEPSLPQTEGEASEGQKTFYVICLAGARAANMSVTEFVEQRFEFCADAIMALREDMARVREKNGVLNDSQFFTLMAGMVPALRYEEGEQKPGWMTDIEEQTKRVQ